MTDAYRIGGFGTNVSTGRVFKALSTPSFGLATNTGICFKQTGADYVVTAGKTFHATGYVMLANAAYNFTATAYVEVRYANNAALTDTPVTMFSVISPAVVVSVPVMISVGNISAPAGKYVGVHNVGAGNMSAGAIVFIVGYEE